MSICPRRVANALAALIVAGALAGCGGGAPPAAMARGPAPVSVVAAVADDVPSYIDEIGRCVASEVVTVLPRVSGEIVEVFVADGVDIAKDAPLFRVDPRPYAATLAQAKAQASVAEAAAQEARTAVGTATSRVASAKSRLAEAKAKVDASRAGIDETAADIEAADADVARADDDLARFERVGPTGAVSGQELDRARTAARGARARADAARTRRVAMEASLRETTASVATAEDGVREAESLVVEASARVTSADAAVARAAAVVLAAQLDVEFCEVLAPIAGRAGRRLVDRGNVVTAGVTTLVSLQRLDPMYVDFSVPEDDLSQVAARMGSKPLSVELRLPDDAGPPRTGTLTFLDNAVDPATGTVRMRAKVANDDRHFWPGRFARVRLVLETLKGAVLVPASAPMTTAQGTVVLVVNADDTASIRPVGVGQRHGDRVVLTSGVVPGDRVVVAGQLGAMAGAKVRVETPAAAPAAPAAPKGG